MLFYQFLIRKKKQLEAKKIKRINILSELFEIGLNFFDLFSIEIGEQR